MSAVENFVPVLLALKYKRGFILIRQLGVSLQVLLKENSIISFAELL